MSRNTRSIKTRQKKKDPRVEELLCHEELTLFNDSPFATAAATAAAATTETAATTTTSKPTRRAKSKAEAIAAAVAASQAQDTASGRGSTKRRAPKNGRATETSEGKPKKKRRTAAERKKPPVQFVPEATTDSAQEAETAPPLDAAALDALSAHVQYGWKALALGERSGSGAWNAALRTQLVRSHPSVSHVPQLSSMECLYRIQQTLPRIPTLVPPSESFLVTGVTTKEAGEEPTNKDNQTEPESDLGKEGDTVNKKSPAKDTPSNTQNGGDKNTSHKHTAQCKLRDLYHLMMTQDVDDGSTLRRDLRFTSASELCHRMGRADKEIVALNERERALRAALRAQGLWKGGDLQQRVARMRGIS